MTDTTVEKLAIIHRAQPRGTLLYRDELAGWLHHLDRYNAGDRPFWLECYGGRSYSVERVKHPEPIVIPRLSVSVLGTIQPDKLNSLLMTGDDDGMLARFVCVWPDPVPLARATPAPSCVKIEGAFERLLGLEPIQDEDGTERPFYVTLTDEAADELFKFRGKVRAWEADAEGLAKSHLGKFPGLALRVATVLAHLDWALDGDEPNGPREITADQFGRAVRFVGDYLRPMAARVYGEAATSAEVAGTRRLAAWIKTERKAAFTRTDVLKAKLPGLRRAAEVKPALDNLTQAAWVQCERQKTGGPPRDLYTVNPAVLA